MEHFGNLVQNAQEAESEGIQSLTKATTQNVEDRTSHHAELMWPQVPNWLQQELKVNRAQDGSL